jgi:predicted nucleotidyltransferase
MQHLTKDLVLSKIKQLKPQYEKEGIVILGLFGSYAKGNQNNTSDIDILYDINSDIFCANYPGFSAFTRLKTIKEELQEIFQTKIDLATIDNDSKTFKEHALKDVVYV